MEATGLLLCVALALSLVASELHPILAFLVYLLVLVASGVSVALSAISLVLIFAYTRRQFASLRENLMGLME